MSTLNFNHPAAAMQSGAGTLGGPQCSFCGARGGVHDKNCDLGKEEQKAKDLLERQKTEDQTQPDTQTAAPGSQ